MDVKDIFILVEIHRLRVFKDRVPEDKPQRGEVRGENYIKRNFITCTSQQIKQY